MFIPAFWVGVFATVTVEFIALVIACAISSMKNKK